jgi:hypothetical protein
MAGKKSPLTIQAAQTAVAKPGVVLFIDQLFEIEPHLRQRAAHIRDAAMGSATTTGCLNRISSMAGKKSPLTIGWSTVTRGVKAGDNLVVGFSDDLFRLNPTGFLPLLLNAAAELRLRDV